MGPHTSRQDLLNELWEFQLANPSVIVTPPDQSGGGMWQVSLPSRSTMAFDSLGGMLRCLSSITSLQQPDDD